MVCCFRWRESECSSREFFFDGNFQLEKGHYYNRDKLLVFQNPYLDDLIRLFKKTQSGQLIIAVPGLYLCVNIFQKNT